MEDNRYRYFTISSPAEYVTHVEINRPEKLNAFSEPVWLELRSIFNEISYAPNVRAVVLSGAGPRAFCSGLDVGALSFDENGLRLSPGMDGVEEPARRATVIRRHIAEMQDCISAVERCEKPVVSVLHGISFGMAIDLVLAADIRICARDTKFSVKEVDIGLAADIGTLSRLPKAVSSASWCKEVCLTARPFDAEEAERVGLVSRVCEDKAQAVQYGIDLAKLIASKSPVAVQSTKELINWSRDHSVADGLRYTGVWNSSALQSKDVPEAVRSILKKTQPKFSKL